MSHIETKAFASIITPAATEIDRLFQAEGYQIRIVGGAVRDSLLGAKPKDVDFASDASPERMLDFLTRAGIRTIPTGLQHGTITAVIDHEAFEITTLRSDVETDGRHAVVAYLDRDTMTANGNAADPWRIDAERRDLTFNAMSATLDGTLYDYFGGREDLVNGRVRFVGDATQRIEEDYLRSLRFFRFHGRLGQAWKYDQDTLTSIVRTAGGLRRISPERIWMETAKILVSTNVASELSTMRDTGVSRVIGLPTPSPAYGRIEEAATVARLSRNPVSALASLFDTADAVREHAEAWRFSARDRELATFLVSNRSLADAPYERFEDLCVGGAGQDLVTELLKSLHRTGEAKRIADWTVPTLPVKGADLVAAGMKPGPEMGRRLAAIKETWRLSRFTMDRTQLLQSMVTKSKAEPFDER